MRSASRSISGDTWHCQNAKQNSRNLLTTSLLIINILCFAVSASYAQIVSAQNGDWMDTNTWIGGTVPGLGDNVIINHTVAINNSITVPIQINNLNIGGSTSNGILEISNASNSGIEAELQIEGDLTLEAVSNQAFLDCKLRAGVVVAGNVKIIRNHAGISLTNVGINFSGLSYMRVGGDFEVDYLGGSDTFREVRLNRASLTVTGDIVLTNSAAVGSGNIHLEVFSSASGLFSTITCRDLIFNINAAGSNQDIVFNCRSGSTLNVLRDFIVTNSGAGEMDLGLGISTNSGNLIVGRNAQLSTLSTGDLTFKMVRSSLWDIAGDLSFVATNINTLSIEQDTIIDMDAGYLYPELHLAGGFIPSTPVSSQFDLKGLVKFDGTSTQNIPVGLQYGSLELDNPMGAQMPSGSIVVGVNLLLTNGIIEGAGNALSTITIAADTTLITGGGTTSFIANATLERALPAAVGPFLFPLGDVDTGYSPVMLNNVSASSFFEVYYFNQNPVNAPTPGPYPPDDKDGTLSVVSHSECWIVNRLSGGDAAVSLGWNANSYVNAIALTDLRIVRWAAGTWQNEGINNVWGDETMGGLTTSGVQTVFGAFTLGSTSDLNTLPVSLLYFEGERKDLYTQLRWKTASEFENSHFEIYKSLAGVDFTLLATIPGGGTRNEDSVYHFTDTHSSNCKTYYQLRQVDFSGKVTPHSIIVVSEIAPVPFSVFPQPVVDDQLSIVIPTCCNGEMFLAVFKESGAKILEQKINNVNNESVIRLNISGLQAGFYFVNLQNKDKVYTSKFFKN